MAERFLGFFSSSLRFLKLQVEEMESMTVRDTFELELLIFKQTKKRFIFVKMTDNSLMSELNVFFFKKIKRSESE